MDDDMKELLDGMRGAAHYGIIIIIAVGPYHPKDHELLTFLFFRQSSRENGHSSGFESPALVDIVHCTMFALLACPCFSQKWCVQDSGKGTLEVLGAGASRRRKLNERSMGFGSAWAEKPDCIGLAKARGGRSVISDIAVRVKEGTLQTTRNEFSKDCFFFSGKEGNLLGTCWRHRKSWRRERVYLRTGAGLPYHLSLVLQNGIQTVRNSGK